MSRHVRGSLFVDYVRMLRGRKDVDWSRHLTTTDLNFLIQRVDPAAWYPMETFERMGVAILSEITGGDPKPARMWGQMSMDGLFSLHPTLLVPNDARESLMRFQVLRRGFFDYPALEILEVSDAHASVQIGYLMGAKAEEAATEQTLGFFDRLLEKAGAQNPEVVLVTKCWAGAARTVVALSWTQ